MDDFKKKSKELIKDFCDELPDVVDTINADTDRPYPMVAIFLAVPRTGDGEAVTMHIKTAANVKMDLTRQGTYESVVAFPMLCSIAHTFARDSVASVMAMAEAQGEPVDDPEELHRELTEVLLEGALKFSQNSGGIGTFDLGPADDDMIQ